MRPDLTSAHPAIRIPAPNAGDFPVHSEKFMACRAMATSRSSSNDIGGILPYQGRRVSFEWQSPQALRNELASCGGMGKFASRALCGRTGGLVAG